MPDLLLVFVVYYCILMFLDYTINLSEMYRDTQQAISAYGLFVSILLVYYIW